MPDTKPIKAAIIRLSDYAQAMVQDGGPAFAAALSDYLEAQSKAVIFEWLVGRLGPGNGNELAYVVVLTHADDKRRDLMRALDVVWERAFGKAGG